MYKVFIQSSFNYLFKFIFNNTVEILYTDISRVNIKFLLRFEIISLNTFYFQQILYKPSKKCLLTIMINF